ncbi:MAG: septum formation initiator family protein [Acidobacteriia bacterium]|nr:septum formation initiator family protein [Terriglobia bacterium]
MALPDNLPSFLRRHGRTILGLLMVLLLMDNIFGTHGYLAMRRTQKEIAALKKDLQRLNDENQQLAEQVKALKSDPQLIEKIARDELGLARPGEVIIRIPQQPANSSAAPGKP